MHNILFYSILFISLWNQRLFLILPLVKCLVNVVLFFKGRTSVQEGVVAGTTGMVEHFFKRLGRRHNKRFGNSDWHVLEPEQGEEVGRTCQILSHEMFK